MSRTTRHDNRLTENRQSSQDRTGIVSGNDSTMRPKMEGNSVGLDTMSGQLDSSLEALKLEPSPNDDSPGKPAGLDEEELGPLELAELLGTDNYVEDDDCEGGDMEPVDIDIRMAKAALLGGYSDDEDDDEDDIISFARKDKINDISWILKREPDRIFAKNKVGNTALHVASKVGHADTVFFLLREGAQAFIANKEGDMPLHLALRGGHKRAASTLLWHDPKVAYQLDSEGVTTLFEAVQQGFDEFVIDLFKKLPRVEVSDSTIELLVQAQPSVVHLVIGAEDLDTLSLMLENIPSLVDSKDADGFKPLSYAVALGHSNIVHYMMKNFPQCLNQADDDGYYPIHNAVRYGPDSGSIKILQKILNGCPKAVTHQTKKKKETIVHVAHKYSQPQVIDYLKNVKTSLLRKISGLADRNGKTAQYLIDRYY